MKGKNALYIVPLFIALVFIPLFLFKADASTEPSTMSQKSNLFNNLVSSRDSSKVLVKINNTTITENSLKEMRIFRQDDLSDSQLLEIAIQNELFYQKGIKDGLVVSNGDIKDFAVQTRKTIETQGAEKQKNDIEEMIKSLGLTDDQFWSSYVLTPYKRMLTIGKVKQHIKDTSAKGISDPEAAEKAYQDALKSTIDELKKQYNIQYFTQVQ